jgi:hypothetical protein
MTSIFISHAKENGDCAEQLRKGLETRGYAVWREPGYPDPNSASYPRMIENAILGSAAVVLVWSNAASQSAWVERHILFTQQLKKSLYVIALDQTNLPSILISISSIPIQNSCMDAVSSLIALSGFPPPQLVDPLSRLYEQAAHEFNRERKAAIDQAAEMLKRNEYRAAVLALLEYMAKHDVMMGIREKAQEVINTDANAMSPSPSLQNLQDTRHTFGVRCKNGHVTYFDKRIVCTAYKDVYRDLVRVAGKQLDELHLRCATCQGEITARVDCEGYK